MFTLYYNKILDYDERTVCKPPPAIYWHLWYQMCPGILYLFLTEKKQVWTLEDKDWGY